MPGPATLIREAELGRGGNRFLASGPLAGRLVERTADHGVEHDAERLLAAFGQLLDHLDRFGRELVETGDGLLAGEVRRTATTTLFFDLRHWIEFGWKVVFGVLFSSDAIA